jgi:hypothetical protein
MLRRDSLGSIGSCGFAGLSPTSNKACHHSAFTCITSVTNLVIKAGRIVTTFIPALLEVGTKFTHFRRPAVRRLAFEARSV